MAAATPPSRGSHGKGWSDVDALSEAVSLGWLGESSNDTYLREHDGIQQYFNDVLLAAERIRWVD